MLNDLFQQLQRDFKKSWQKTAVLGVLFAVGLCFWVPPLVSAFSGPAEVQPAAPAKQPEAAQAVSASSSSSISSTAEGSQTAFSWVAATELLEQDPLLQSIEVAAVEGDPFRVDHDQFPPPVLFANEIELPKGPAVPKSTVIEAPSQLKLKSTIVGSRRRAAYINQQMCFEGQEYELEGVMYRLLAVFPRRVEMSCGTDMFELKIERVGGAVRSQALAVPVPEADTPPSK